MSIKRNSIIGLSAILMLAIITLNVTDATPGIVFDPIKQGICFYGKNAQFIINRVFSIASKKPTCPPTTVCPKCPTCQTCPKCPKPKKKLPKECSDLVGNNRRSGVYKVYPQKGLTLEVYCDMDTDGGGWTVFQKRYNGQTYFYRGWKEYERGFGNKNGEFWLGNRYLHIMTSKSRHEMRIDLVDFKGKRAYAEYSDFSIGDRRSYYTLTASGYVGTAGNGLRHHYNQPFSTKDSDHDKFNKNCAVEYRGAWWYNTCHDSNLNGLYLGNKVDNRGMRWKPWQHRQTMKSTQMMFRRPI